MRAFMSRPVQDRGAVLNATYSLPLENMSPKQLEDEKQSLTMQPKSSFGPPPPPFNAWFVHNNRFHMPRFYGLEKFGNECTDERSVGSALPEGTAFSGTLTSVQVQAQETVMTKYMSGVGCGAMICLPCGMGKTVLTVSLIVQLGRRAAILVHKGVIRDQWIAAFARFAPNLRVGVIQGKRFEVEGYDVVIAMIMTLAKREIDPAVLSSVGTVAVDECHHLAAPVMNKAMRCFEAKHVLGLTATKERPDGLTPLLHYTLGPEAFRVERDGGEKVEVSIALFPNATREIKTRDGKPLVSVMTNNLAAHHGRNMFIATRAVEMRKNGRVIMILSDRIKQLETLQTLIIAQGIPESEVGLFYGATRDTDRAEQLDRNIVLCSYAMANEGVDKREADTCIMATPKGRVIQCIGRVQRPCETKKSPLVLDIADDVSVFVPLRWKRQKLYSQEHYKVQVLLHDAPSTAWFA